MRLHTRAVWTPESALKMDSRRKIPCHTEESSLPQQHTSPTLLLSYIAASEGIITLTLMSSFRQVQSSAARAVWSNVSRPDSLHRLVHNQELAGRHLQSHAGLVGQGAAGSRHRVRGCFHHWSHQGNRMAFFCLTCVISVGISPVQHQSG